MCGYKYECESNNNEKRGRIESDRILNWINEEAACRRTRQQQKLLLQQRENKEEKTNKQKIIIKIKITTNMA